MDGLNCFFVLKERVGRKVMLLLCDSLHHHQPQSIIQSPPTHIMFGNIGQSEKEEGSKVTQKVKESPLFQSRCVLNLSGTYEFRIITGQLPSKRSYSFIISHIPLPSRSISPWLL